MSTRIDKTFATCRREGRAALVVFASVGCPTPAESESLIDRLIANGADMIELGVPFSDPTADGPVIQQAGQRALKAGTRFEDVLAIAKRIRKKYPDTPLILFTYYNILFNLDSELLGQKLTAAGIDAVLVVDLPLEERGEFLPMCEKFGIDFIPLVSPATPPERAKAIASGCSGFVYYITVRGVTGVRTSLPAELASELESVRKLLPLPVAAGFGISTPEMAKAVSAHADAVVVGSAMVKHALDGDADGAVKLIADIAAALRG